MISPRIALVFILIGIATCGTLNANLNRFLYVPEADSAEAAHAAANFEPYNGYVLAMQWLLGSCSTTSCPSTVKPGQFFTLHGLWPSDLTSLSTADNVQNCEYGTKLKLSNFPTALQADVNTYWPSIVMSTEQFVKYEWEKHGSCWNPAEDELKSAPANVQTLIKAGVAAKTLIDKQAAYVKLAITMLKDADLFKKLAAKNILPSYDNSVKKSVFADALKRAFNVNKIEVVCSTDADGYSLLTEIRICYDLAFKPTDCSKDSFRCPSDFYYTSK